MRLVRDSQNCSKCGLCLDACLFKPKTLAFLDCRQCAELDADCANCNSAVKTKSEVVHCTLEKCVADGGAPRRLPRFAFGKKP
ncbi:MAG: hypothetical protein QW343_03470 [Candidatus Norongarragalinales archaeon]